MRVSRGDVVLIDLPFFDGSGVKVRPVLVVQADARNAILNQTVVAMISRNLTRVGTDPTQLLVDVTTPDGRQAGLNASSAILAGNLFTVDQGRIQRRLGRLAPALMSKVNAGLKLALNIP